MAIENLLFDVSDALRIPVLVLALLALVFVIVEIGALLVEVYRRRDRSMAKLDKSVDAAQTAMSTGKTSVALDLVKGLAYNPAMAAALGAIVEYNNNPDRVAKRLAEYDYYSLKRLERTRMLVRIGPALGLMGTLIPLSPALAGLASGNVTELTDNLRVAFSVTVAGLLVGAIAFAISLVRDRLYGQDFSDVEYVAASLAPVKS